MNVSIIIFLLEIGGIEDIRRYNYFRNSLIEYWLKGGRKGYRVYGFQMFLFLDEVFGFWVIVRQESYGFGLLI